MHVTPTPAQINAAQMVIVAESFYTMVNMEFDQWKQELITLDQFHIAEEYYSEVFKKWNYNFPADRIIRDPQHCRYIEGYSFTGAQPGTDADRFYTALKQKAIQFGFLHAERADEVASLDLYSRKCSLIDMTHALHCQNREDLNERTFDGLVMILTGMFATVVDSESLIPLSIQYYNERMLESAQQEMVFVDSEASFAWFKALKKYAPVTTCLPNIFPNPDAEDHQRVEGIEFILSYMPDCHIFQMKAGGRWMYDNHKSTNCQYAFIDLNDELIESDDLETVERALFKHFLQYLHP